MDILIKYGKDINKAYIAKYTKYGYDPHQDWEKCCYTTQKALLCLFECQSCYDPSIANFVKVYMEYKEVGHGACIYNGMILQSFGNHYYLTTIPFNDSIDELMKNPKKFIHLFYPLEFLELGKEEKIYIKCTYYVTNISDDKLTINLAKLLDAKIDTIY